MILPHPAAAGNPPTLDAERLLLARWPHLAKPGPNWRELERRAQGLPPELPDQEAQAIAEAVWPILEPRIQQTIARALASTTAA